MKLLIVEDEPMLLEEMENYLSEQGYLCEHAINFEKAEEKISLYDYDVIILDITLPGGNGLQLMTLPKQRRQTGILIVSARNSLSDKLIGLQKGADDYLTKPFHLEELNARIHALLRRRSFSGQTKIVFDDLTIDTDAHEVTGHSEIIPLTKKEYQLLLYFVVNKNRVLSKQAIAEHLWGDHYDLADNYDTVYVHTMNLRKKITARTGKDYIKTVYGMGYKFTQP